jgi:hypothetical protein
MSPDQIAFPPGTSADVRRGARAAWKAMHPLPPIGPDGPLVFLAVTLPDGGPCEVSCCPYRDALAHRLFADLKNELRARRADLDHAVTGAILISCDFAENYWAGSFVGVAESGGEA